MRFLLLLAFFVGAFGLCPLSKAKNPVDRQGLRHYSVIFTESAPRFELNQLRTWAQNFSAVDPSKIGDSWSIGNFAGFPAWLSSAGLGQLRQHPYVSRIAEAPKLKIHPMETNTANVQSSTTSNDFTRRPDWGQMRVQQKIRNLATNPAGLFDRAKLEADGYPSGEAPTYDGTNDGSWSWTAPYSMPNTGSLAHIWVADSGINHMHQEFIDPSTGQSRVIRRIDCTDDASPGGVDGCVPSQNPDVLGHGTHVAGSAAGRFRGIAPGASIGSVRIFNNNTDGDGTWAISAVAYVVNNQIANKFNILSMSIGGGPDYEFTVAIRAAWEAGLTVVVAAGNDGDEACDHSPPDGSDPVNTTSVITVGAIDANDNRADFSNYGICTKIFAPGVQIHSAWINSTTNYNTIDGTSMATPIVSGSVAVLVSRFPGFRITPTAARNMLFSLATANVVNDTRNSVNRLAYVGAF